MCACVCVYALEDVCAFGCKRVEVRCLNDEQRLVRKMRERLQMSMNVERVATTYAIRKVEGHYVKPIFGLNVRQCKYFLDKFDIFYIKSMYINNFGILSITYVKLLL